MDRKCYLIREEHIPEKAAFPVIDAHNHLWGDKEVESLVNTMDAVGVVCFANLTANARIAFEGGGYVVRQKSFESFLEACANRYPGKFYGFTMVNFANPVSEPLFENSESFVEEAICLLREHVALGARGLKVLTELGMHYRDASGKLISVDDPRLSEIWEEAGRLGVPVLIHQSNPVGLFDPASPENEHYETLVKYPSWSYSDPVFPRKAELLERRDNLVRGHPNTTFILPHVANFAENLGYVSDLLEENPNVYIDFSSRIDELGRQPYSAREFFIRFQDRILFGTDTPVSVEVYRCYFRFLETFDEYFFPPDYDGTFERRRWAIYGLGLPREVLTKIYYQNALCIIPGLKNDLKGVFPDTQ